MTKFQKITTIILANLLLSLSAHAAKIVNDTNNKAVGNVHWQKVKQVNVQDLLNQPMPANTANVIFLRQADADTIQTSANVAINDRFQVSLQPGNFSQIYSCSGVNQISGDITGHKTNDLLRNVTTFKLEPNTTYFFDVDVDNQGNTTINHITQDRALSLLQNMNYQTHQITRVVANCPPAPEPVTPPPAPPAVVTTTQYETIYLNVLFDNDKSVVKPQYFEEIKRVADFMQRHPEVTATIEGHTDSNASDSYNLKLSQRRVDAVKQVLIHTFGVDGNRLNSIGYGESRPVASNATAEGRQQNRRVVAVFQAN